MMGLNSLKELSPARYESFIKDDPPMDIDTVMKSMRDFVEYVSTNRKEDFSNL